MEKAEKKAVFDTALIISREYPGWCDYSCLGEALLRCIGENYETDPEELLPGYEWYKKLNSEQNDEECDATEADQGAGNKK